MKKQQIISLTGTSLLAAIIFGEGCCCPSFPIGEILLCGLIVDIFDNFDSFILYVILPFAGVILFFAILKAFID